VIEPYDRTEPVTGRRLLIVHGDRDRITDPRHRPHSPSGPPGADASYVSVHGSAHAMLRRARPARVGR